MSVPDCSLQKLADRINQGDPSALPVFERELGRQLTRVVRRALRAEGSPSPLARRIQAEARELDKGDPDGRRLVDRVAEGLRAAVVGHLRAGCPSQVEIGDTVCE